MTESTSFAMPQLCIERRTVLYLFGITAVKTSKLLKLLSIFYNAKYLVTIPNSELQYPTLVLYPNVVKLYLNIKLCSIYQPMNAYIISHKTLLKHFKTLRHVSMLSDHHQGALFLAKVILQYSQFNSYM